LALLAIPIAGCVPDQPASAGSTEPPEATAPVVQAQPVAAPPQPQPAPLQPPSAEQQRVRNLIDQVEAAYTRGDADYKKGMLAEAKVEFDHAVDLMLSSGIDIRSNEQLSDEFDRIVDQVNGLEMEALKQGNGFVPKVEETPADVASDVTFAVDPNLVAKARADLATTKSDLPMVMNDYVAAYINFFANTQRGHYTLLHSFQRAGRYKAMIQRVLAEEGVPQDLIYLAVAESGFQPRALNPRSHAGGMWQFMPTGQYGLARNAYVDERFDPEKSTRAYGRYMKYIYDQLGDWYLAMAAYDHGAGNIQHEVAKTGYADFWELYKRHELPGETANYVPQILAAIIIANHPTQYGFDDVTLDPPVLTDTVTVNYSIDLRLVSDLVGAPVDELEALNPSLLRMVTPPESSYDLHLPAGTAELFTQRAELIPEAKRNSWRYHTVVAGDTIESVAREYRVQPAELASVNQVTATASLEGVGALVVPVAPELAPSAHTAYYTARRGDTLITIADRFGVSLAQLRRWNNLASSKVEPGSRLHVAEPVSATRSSSGRRHSKSAGASAHAAQGKSAPAAKAGGNKTGSARAGSATSGKTSHKKPAGASGH
jgi:membrane-bound lytic murein transglycosylase D